MDDADFDHVAREELRHLEDSFSDIDPDDVEVSTSDGVLRLDLRDGTRIVINSHRAARQIWMAAVASAWHFDPVDATTWRANRPPTGRDSGVSDQRPMSEPELMGQMTGPPVIWRASKTGEELRPTLARLVKERIGLAVSL